jgi:hypothetical protein
MSLTLTKPDKDFIYSKITLMDFKTNSMERVLVSLLARLKNNGNTSTVIRKEGVELTVPGLVDEYLQNPEQFQGFQEHADVVRSWFETHLVDIVNRGKKNAALASPRPLHGYVYRFRNAKYSKVYGIDKQIYELLNSVGREGQMALTSLRAFFFPEEDPLTGSNQKEVLIDVETEALQYLKSQVKRDTPSKDREINFKPLCFVAPRVFAEDITRLLAYRDHVPRSVMVEYLVTLMGFHLGLYLLRMIHVVPQLVEARGELAPCAGGSACRCLQPLLVDVAGLPKTGMAKLAERSMAQHTNQIPVFVRANFTARKLEDYASHLRKTRSMPLEGLADVLRLTGPKHTADREGYFQHRLARLLDDQPEDELPPEQERLLELATTNMDKYIELIVFERSEYHRKFVNQALDSFFFKNSPSAMLHQSSGHGSPRRFVMGGRILEVLLQIILLQPGGQHGFHTGPLRFTELLEQLRTRYGIHIDRLPPAMGEPSVADHAALRENVEAMKIRLRELGFYRDLSDASATQFVSPRYTVAKSPVANHGAA